jgi:hypothetical protein
VGKSFYYSTDVSSFSENLSAEKNERMVKKIKEKVREKERK